MTGLVAIVPVRSLSNGKSRLASWLTDEARGALTRSMTRRVLQAAIDSGTIETVAVVSPDEDALAFAREVDDRIVGLPQEPGSPGLNAALAQGRAWADQRGAAGMLILFSDLPLLSPGDVRNIARRDAAVVLAPDRHGQGTNALLLRLGGSAAGSSFAFQFGSGSYGNHIDEAHRLGLDPATASLLGSGFDLDTPDDFRALQARGWTAPDAPRQGALAAAHGSGS